MSQGLTFLYDHPLLYRMGLKMAPIINRLPRFLVYNPLNAWGKGRELPTFAKDSFGALWKKGKVK
jgi:L-lactate dehydrogenase complex protein LldF